LGAMIGWWKGGTNAWMVEGQRAEAAATPMITEESIFLYLTAKITIGD